MPRDISDIPSVKIHLPQGESESFPYLQRISKSISANPKKNTETLSSVKRNLSDLFSEKIDQLIGELILHPEEDKTYLELGQRLKEFDKETFDEINGTISSIRMIAGFLRKGEVDKLNTFTRKIESPNDYYRHIPRSTVLHFSKLRLPDDLKAVRAIKNETLKFSVMAELINRDKVQLEDLKISKKELKAIAPYLTYLDCKATPDYFKNEKWTSDEIKDLLKNCTSLKTLKISSSLLKEMPKLENCEVIDCSKCINLEKISDQPMVIDINFRHCHHLKEIGALSNCRNLRGEENHKLKKLPSELPKVKIFELSDCAKLKQLPVLDNCEHLICNHLTLLRQLPNLPACKILSCANSALTSLPELLNCLSLDCSLCHYLTRLPNLFVCTELTADDCPQLENDPTRLRIELASGEINEDTAEISIFQLNSNPLGVLLDLNPYLQNGYLPKIRYRETDDRISQGLDAGGLRNNLVSRLIDSLASNAEVAGQLTFIKEEGLQPVLDKNSENFRDQIKGFQALGNLFAICLNQGYLTGNVFNPNLFKMIESTSYDELVNWPEEIEDLPQEIRLSLRLSATEGQEALQNTLHLLAKDPLDLTKEEYESLKQLYEYSGEALPEDIDLKEPSDSNKKFVFDKCQESFSEIMKDVELPTVIIAKQMVTLCESPEKWEEWCEGAMTLQEKIEGMLTKNLVLQAISWESPLTEDAWKPTKKFVKQWISEASKEDLKNLVFTITGFNSLSTDLNDDKKLKFQFFNRDEKQFPVAHACFSSIEIPINYPNYEVFKEKLEFLIKQSTNKDHSGFEVK